jgi:hypothetical protein
MIDKIRKLKKYLNYKYITIKSRYSNHTLNLPDGTAVFLIGKIRDRKVYDNILRLIPDNVLIFSHTDKFNSSSNRKNMYTIDDTNHEFIMELDIIKEKYFSNTGLIQWLRLKHTMNEMKRFEKKINKKFKFILKIRTDWIITRSNFEDCEWDDNTVYAARDHIFFSKRDSFLTLCNLYDYKDTYFANTFKYSNIDYDCLVNSDWDACRFDCLYYPLRIVGEISSSSLLKKSIIKNIDELLLYQPQDGDEYISMSRHIRNFSSEAIMVLHLNKHHKIIKSSKKYINGFLDLKRKNFD